jgi:hypothetical protein
LYADKKIRNQPAWLAPRLKASVEARQNSIAKKTLIAKNKSLI